MDKEVVVIGRSDIWPNLMSNFIGEWGFTPINYSTFEKAKRYMEKKEPIMCIMEVAEKEDLKNPILENFEEIKNTIKSQRLKKNFYFALTNISKKEKRILKNIGARYISKWKIRGNQLGQMLKEANFK